MARVEQTENSSGAPKVGTLLLSALERMRVNQAELLETADFVLANEATIDGAIEHAQMRLKTEYPDVDEALIVEGWEIFTREFAAIGEGITAIDEDSGMVAAPPARDTPEEKSVIDQYVSRLPDVGALEFLQGLSMAVVLMRNRTHSERIFAPLLTSLIADFEVLIASVMRSVIEIHPEIILTTESNFSWSEIVKHKDLDGFRSAQIQKKIDGLLFGSFEDWLKFLQTKIHIDIPALLTNGATKEIFQRRHMIVHNGGLASEHYFANCPDETSNADVGDPLVVDVEYLRGAADRLLAIGVYITHAIVQKFIKSSSETDLWERYLGESVAYPLVQSGRFSAMADLSTLIMHTDFSQADGGYRFRVNGWLANKRVGKLEDHREAIQKWDITALKPEFRLAKLALLDDLDKTVDLAMHLQDSNTLPLRHWLTWPLLEEAREHAKTRGGDRPVEQATAS